MPASLTSSLVGIAPTGVEATVAHIARGRATETIEMQGGAAYKWTAEAKGTDELAGIQSAVVYYVCPLPGDKPDSAIIFAFGVLKVDGLSPEYTQVLYLLFDAMMQSLVWIRDEND